MRVLFVARAQNRLASLLGCEPDRRATIVRAMMHRGAREVTGYWLQLVIATGIATLGLALGSTAVIIGAMLVAPLMGPIVGLGMGLATGSPVLVLRAAGRAVVSIGVVLVFSAALMHSLPFHELNSEIASRTTPTAIDLATAIFCAVAGVYASMRPGSDVATTAAGTSIGISLVPPVCVAGFGVGTASVVIAKGALLLFFTNFVAIVLVSTLAFAAAGFGRTDIPAVEDAELDASPRSLLSRPAARALTSRLRGARGPWIRLLMPFALLAALYSPLRAGLDQVAWQIGARNAVDGAVARVNYRVVQARTRVEHREVEVVLFLLGTDAEAAATREKLTAEITRTAGVVPRVEVHAVADSTEFETLERSTVKPPPQPALVAAEPPPPPPPPPTPREQLADARQIVRDALQSRWPSASAGTPLRIGIETLGEAVGVRVTHLGAPLEPATIELLGSTLSDDLETTIAVTDVAIPAAEVDIVANGPSALPRLAAALTNAAEVDSIFACVTEPAPPARGAPQKLDKQLLESTREVLKTFPRVKTSQGAKLSVRLATGGCERAPE